MTVTPAKVRPKRRPKQARSQETVRRILDAALAVLARDGVEGLTTNHIADEAGLSVASVYQFFPNKQAVIYAAYQDWLGNLDQRIEAVALERRDERDWRAFAETLASVLGAYQLSSETEAELLRAMWSHRELIDLDRRHNERLGRRVAQLMAAYGPGLAEEELVTLASFANEIFTLATERSAGKPAAERARISDFAKAAYVALWATAFEAGTAKHK